MENETKKYCPLNNFKPICDNGCAWYNNNVEECSVLTISKELIRIEWGPDNIQSKI